MNTSNRTVALVALAIAATVVLAGCSNVGVGQPKPYTESGEALNGTDVRDAHANALQNASSFRSTATLVIGHDEGSARVNRSIVIDRTANRSREIVRFESDAADGASITIDTYENHSVTYRRFVVEGESGSLTQHDAASAPYDDGPMAVRPVDASAATKPALIAAIVDDVNWTQQGVEKYNGSWVTRYNASGPGNFSELTAATSDVGSIEVTDSERFGPDLDYEVERVDATLLVDPDGVVRYVRVEMVGAEGVAFTLRYSTSDVGSATVEEPGWTSEVDAPEQ